MDFEYAAKRLAKDQSKLKGRRKVEVSAKAKREVEMGKKQQELLLHQRHARQRDEAFREEYMTQCNRALGVKQLSVVGPLQLQATSIHGEGDKIALPPSILQYLTTTGQDDTISTGSPWTFRMGILNPNYLFPGSSSLQLLTAPSQNNNDSSMNVDDDDDSDDETTSKEMYLDEMKHKYLAFTYGSVVEFTQDEDKIGLPAGIAGALLDPARRSAVHSSIDIPVTRTVDPAAAADSKEKSDGSDDNMEQENNNDGKTPGHFAWGAFDVPSLSIEVSMVQLPKGRACTLVPTHEAIRNGFFTLKDVKMVLEQSLIRTRATLSVGDMVHTWHRGKKYDLRVTTVTPSQYAAVTCINTDIEVDIGEVEGLDDTDQTMVPVSTKESTGVPFGGQTLGSSAGRRLDESSVALHPEPVVAPALADSLIPEPSSDQSENVCNVQIRANGAHARRRFNVQHATLKDLFAFAATLTNGDEDFRLVTRFPRRVFAAQDGASLLINSGIEPGQELFLVERL